MSAETLRRSAVKIREDWDTDTDRRSFAKAHAYNLAVADWLDAIATRADEIADTIGSPRVAESVIAGTLPGFPQALAAARAYLGESA